MTDIGESLFRRWLVLRSFVTDRFSEPSPSEVKLSELEDRLKVLGALFTGRALEIKGGDLLDDGKGAIIFPEKIDLLDSRPLNETLMIYRLTFVATASDLKIFIPDTFSREERLLLTLAAVSSVTSEIDRRFPQAPDLRQILSSKLLAKLPQQRREARTRGEVYTAIITRLLGDERRHKNGAIDAVIEHVVTATKPLKEDFELLWQKLSALAPSPGVLDLTFAVLWGLASEDFHKVKIEGVPEYGTINRNAKTIQLDRTVHAKLEKPPTKKAVPLFHSFEKTETADEYRGEQGDSEATNVDQEEAALRELAFSTVIRTVDETPGLVKADMVIDGACLEVEETDIKLHPQISRYHEWNYRTGNYREDWCTLFEYATDSKTEARPDYIKEVLRNYRTAIQDIRREFLRLLASREARDKQIDGPEIDLEAMIERYADLHAGRSLNHRLYISDRKALHDVAVLLLFDTSLSTDSWVEGRRVLEVERDSVAILSAAFEGYLDDEVSIAHFNSRTRHECSFHLIKKFGEEWKASQRRLSDVEPHGYTRIGPAIRHATKLLKDRKARRKLLLLVSDGKPSDYDQYEGRYGIEDVAQAVREAGQHRISTFAITVDHEAKRYMANMMGVGKFKVLPRAGLLPQAIAEFLLKAVA